MGGIPLLNDRQMNSLRRILGTNQKLDLTTSTNRKARKLPSFGDDVMEPTESTCLGIITGASDAGVYDVTLYADGLDKPSTGSGKLFAVELALGSRIPVGTVVIAHPIDATLTGGNEQ